MRIFLVPCTYTCLNMGDVAMLQVAVDRLLALWPGARIDIPTKDPVALRRYCPSAHPLPHGDWFADHHLLGAVHRRVPRSVSDRLADAKWIIRRHRPSLEEAAVRWKLRVRGAAAADFEAVVDAARRADLVLVSGTGGITDTFPTYSLAVLGSLAKAIRSGKPTAMFSHGLGPLRNARLFRRAASVLPRVDLIALREGLMGPALLKAMGVDASRIAVTGDDAVETAYRAGPECSGGGIGVNIRVGSAAGVDSGVPAVLRPLLQEFARAVGGPLLAVPIARQQSLDAEAIEEILEGAPEAQDGGRDLDTPLKVIERVGRCRIVVTGAYHAAVFALSQGIPVVCLAGSAYYVDKFRGLADIFGTGCENVFFDSDNWTVALREALKRAWESAEAVRQPLRRAAAAQIEASRRAYWRVGEIAAARGLPPKPVHPFNPDDFGDDDAATPAQANHAS
jgi:colanic acid/amylovoran biosynthesis protein